MHEILVSSASDIPAGIFFFLPIVIDFSSFCQILKTIRKVQWSQEKL